MDEILSQLPVNSSFTIKTDQLPELWKYCNSQPDLYSFRYDYFEDSVMVTLTDKYLIPKTQENEQTK